MQTLHDHLHHISYNSSSYYMHDTSSYDMKTSVDTQSKPQETSADHDSNQMLT